MEIAVPLFDRFTALDAIGPYQVLSLLPGVTVRFLAPEPGPVRTDNGMLTVVAEGRYEDVPEPDVVVVPGGPGTRAALSDEGLLEWVRTAHERSRYTTSVCTGSLVLAAAGLLQGRRAAIHWAYAELLESLGATPARERWLHEERFLTAAGGSAGIDVMLYLVSTLKGVAGAKLAQLATEYDPSRPSAVSIGAVLIGMSPRRLVHRALSQSVEQ